MPSEGRKSKRLFVFSRKLADAIVAKIRENILSARGGDDKPYGLTTFPRSEKPRIPFIRLKDDWYVRETGNGFNISAHNRYWHIHRAGAVILPVNYDILVIRYKGEKYKVKRAIIPKRDPVPGREQILELVKKRRLS